MFLACGLQNRITRPAGYRICDLIFICSFIDMGRPQRSDRFMSSGVIEERFGAARTCVRVKTHQQHHSPRLGSTGFRFQERPFVFLALINRRASAAYLASVPLAMVWSTSHPASARSDWSRATA